MSVQVSASGARVARTGLAVTGNWTDCGFYRRDSDSGDYEAAKNLGNSANMTGASTEWGVNNADRLYAAYNDGNSGVEVNTYASDGSATSFPVGQWMFVAQVRSGTTLTTYVAPAESTTALRALTAITGLPAITVSEHRVSDSPFGSTYRWRGDAVGDKFWSAALTVPELELERRSFAAVRTANLVANWQMLTSGAAGTDSSGAGLTKTITGTVTTDTNPTLQLGDALVTATAAVPAEAMRLQLRDALVAAQGVVYAESITVGGSAGDQLVTGTAVVPAERMTLRAVDALVAAQAVAPAERLALRAGDALVAVQAAAPSERVVLQLGDALVAVSAVALAELVALRLVDALVAASAVAFAPSARLQAGDALVTTQAVALADAVRLVVGDALVAAAGATPAERVALVLRDALVAAQAVAPAESIADDGPHDVLVTATAIALPMAVQLVLRDALVTAIAVEPSSSIVVATSVHRSPAFRPSVHRAAAIGPSRHAARVPSASTHRVS